MTKIFVPLLAAAMFVFGTANAQKPAPAVKKVAPPVNKMPVPVARPVVPVAKPAAPAPKPVAAPVVAKPVAAPAPKPVAAPKPAPVAAKPAPAPVTKPAPSIQRPATVAKPATIKKKVVTRKTVVTKKKTHVTPPVAAPVHREPVASPVPYVREEKPATRVIEREEEVETESKNAPCAGTYHSINGCTCYKDAPDDCIPWKFRNRRYYRYNYTLEHYRNCKHESKNCCDDDRSCRHSRRAHNCH